MKAKYVFTAVLMLIAHAGFSVNDPTGFTATATSDTSIQLSWSLNGSGDPVILAFNTVSSFGVPVDGTVYNPGNAIPGGGTVLYSGAGTSFSHYVLNPSTVYYYKLWSVETGEIYSSGIIASDTTICGILPACSDEFFEHGGLAPDCWTQKNISGSLNWIFTEGNPYSNVPDTAFDGTYNAFLGCSAICTNAQTMLISPRIDFTSDPAALSFRVFNPNDLQLKVYYRTSSSGAWTALSTSIASYNGTWMNYVINLPTPGPDYYIAFEAKVLSSPAGVCIDHVSICQGCLLPVVNSIIGVSSLCDNGAGASSSWSVIPEAGVTYEWQISNSPLITTGTSRSGSFPGFSIINITVTPKNACGYGTSKSMGVCVGMNPGMAPVPTGQTNPCVGSTQVYSASGLSTNSFTMYSWSLPPGWTLVNQNISPPTASVTVTVGASSGTVDLNIVNIYCTPNCPGQKGSLAVTPKTVPLAPSAIIQNDFGACSGITVFSVTNTSGVTYTWSIIGDATVTGGQGTNTTTATVGMLGGVVQVNVVPSNSCGNGPASQLSTCIKTPAGSLPGTVSGNIAPCVGSVQTYTAPFSGFGDALWTYPTGWTVVSSNTNSPTASITLNVGTFSGSVQLSPVTYTCSFPAPDCMGAGPYLMVNPVSAVPAQPSAITGNSVPCAGTSAVYSVTNVSGLAYTWTFPSGWNITAGQNTSSVTVTAGSTSGNVTVTPSNSCGNGVPRTLAVNPGLLPFQPGPIAGSASPCAGTSQTYYFTGTPGENYSWSFPSGWSQTGGGTTDSVTVTTGSNSGIVQVVPSNTCGSGPSASVVVSVLSAPSQPGTINGPGLVCSGSTQVYAIPDVSGVLFNWSLPAGWILSGGGNTDTITVVAGNTSGTISVSLQNSCGTGPSQNMSADVVLSVPSTPVISGPASPCTGTIQQYSVLSESNTIFNWSLPLGWTLNSGGTTNEIDVVAGSPAGAIVVSPSNLCGIGQEDTLWVSSLTVPSQPSSIDGDTLICAGLVYSYQVNPEPGLAWNWSFPSGWNQTGGGTTEMVTVLANSNSGIVQVVPSNACGNGMAQNLNVIADSLPFAPDSIIGPTYPCEGDLCIYQVYSSETNWGYHWTFPLSWAPAFPPDTTDIASAFAGSGSGFIIVEPYNGCGAGTTLQVEVFPQQLVVPEIQISALPSVNLCFGDSVIVSSLITNGGTNPELNWYVNGMWAGDSSSVVMNNPADGTGIYAVLVSDNACVTNDTVFSDTLILDVQPAPAVPLISVSGDTLSSSYPNGNQWYQEDLLMTGETNQEYIVPVNGYYYVMYTDSFGCFSVSDSVYVTVTNGSVYSWSSAIRIYPNPATSTLVVELLTDPERIYEVWILDITGRVVHFWKPESESRHVFELAGMNPGLYLIRVDSEEGFYRTKIVKQ